METTSANFPGGFASTPGGLQPALKAHDAVSRFLQKTLSEGFSQTQVLKERRPPLQEARWSFGDLNSGSPAVSNRTRASVGLCVFWEQNLG